MSKHLRAVLLRYGVAVAAAGLAILGRGLFSPLWGAKFPLLTFYPAIALVAWYGGFGPGFLTTVLCAAAADYLLMAPIYSLQIDDPGEAVALALFISIGMLICHLTDSLRSARRREEAKSFELQREVADRMRSEESLRRSEARYRRLFETNIVGVAISYADGRLKDGNDAFLRLTGIAREEVEAGTARWDERTAPEYLEISHAMNRKLRELGVIPPFEKEYVHRDGTRVSVMLASATLDGSEEHVTFALDITDRKRAERERTGLLERTLAAQAEAERRRLEAEVLAELVADINASLDLSTLLPKIGEAARKLCGGDGGRIALLDDAGQEMLVQCSTGAPSVMPAGFRITRGKGPGGLAWASGRPVRSGDLAADPRFAGQDLPVARADGIVSCLVVPIRRGERVEGLIYISNLRHHPFTEEDEAVAMRLADQAAIAIRNAQFLAREQAGRGQAEAANRAKDEFLAMLGHELRNPLGAVTNAAAALQRLDDQAGPLRAIIAQQSANLARLVDDLLDAGRLTAGKITIERRPVNLRSVAERALAAVQHSGSAAGHRISVDAKPLVVAGDATRLEQILGNLLDNAIKYTPPGGEISVRVEEDGGDAVLRVRDSGIGITPELLPQVFDLFVQAPRAVEQGRGGLGIGLTVVRRLVALHGGTVAVSSEGPGRGSEFSVRLPLLRSRDLITPEPPARDIEVPRCVLLVEHHDDSRASLHVLLELTGHQVAEASDGERGVAAALALRPEVVLIDIGLPGMDGYEVARRIRAAPRGDQMVLVALTGYGQPEDSARAMQAGSDAHLLKPVEADRLAQVLVTARRDVRPGEPQAGGSDGLAGSLKEAGGSD